MKRAGNRLVARGGAIAGRGDSEAAEMKTTLDLGASRRQAGGVLPGSYAVIVGKSVEIVRKKAKTDASGLPAELQIFPFPEYTNDDGTFVTDAESQKACVAYFNERGVKIPIDYEHQTMLDEIAPAAGFIGALVAGGKAGLLASAIEWNARAAEFIRSGEYRYHSPVYLVETKTGRVVAVLCLALTNLPKSHHQVELYEQVAAKAIAQLNTAKGGTTKMEDFIQSLRYMLGLSLTTTMTELKAALQKVHDALPDGDAMLMEVSAKAGDGDKPMTIADALGLTALAENGEDAAEAGEVAAPAELLELLELPAEATIAEIQAKVIDLRAPAGMVSREEHDRVVAELAQAKKDLAERAAKTDAERLDQMIEANRAKISPAKEPWIRQLAAKHGLDHAKEVVAKMSDELPKTQSVGTDPDAAELQGGAPATINVAGKAVDVDPDRAQLKAKIDAFQRSKGIKTYAEAAKQYERENAAR